MIMQRRINQKMRFLHIIISLLFSFSAPIAIANGVESNISITKIDPSFYKISPHDIVYGKSDASISVLEYYSLTCPHCAYFYLKIFPSIKRKYIDTGYVKWIKRLYVIDQASMDGSLLLNCIQDDKQRKNYLTILLSKQSSWAFQKDPSEVLSNIASLGGINHQKFQKCMKDKDAEHRIKSLSIKAINEAKIEGTPSFYINAEKLEAFSEKSFTDSFDKILAK